MTPLSLLLKEKDEKYKVFSKKIVSDTKYPVIGVRVPKIREIAKSLTIIGDTPILPLSYTCYEECLLYGLIIAGAKIPFGEKTELFNKYLPFVDSWGITDSVTAAFKDVYNNREKAIDFIYSLLKSPYAYSRRFGVVLLTLYFTGEYFKAEHVENVLSLKDGEYYIDKSSSGSSIHFHAFFRQPSRHYMIDYRQYEECAEICISTENNIIKRRGIENSCRILSEGIFCQAFKMVLEFFFDGSAIPTNQPKLWDTLDAITNTNLPDEPVLINDEYYYLRARELMLQRKEELKTRLLELDDIPSKRRELRAEIKGIDYCVSILDKNH